MVHNRFSAAFSRPYHCCYVSRKRGKPYARSHREILDAFGSRIVHYEEMHSIFRDAIGDFGYLARSPSLDEIHSIARFIHELR